MLHINRTDEAESDLIEIWQFIADDNMQAADRMYALLESKMNRLTDFPKMGSPRDDLSPGLRSLVVGNYLIFYRLEADRIDILRVLQGMQDLPAFFDPANNP